jgi:hypothetical protein
MIRGVNILVWKHLLLLYYRHFLFNFVGPASLDDEAEEILGVFRFFAQHQYELVRTVDYITMSDE